MLQAKVRKIILNIGLFMCIQASVRKTLKKNTSRALILVHPRCSKEMVANGYYIDGTSG